MFYKMLDKISSNDNLENIKLFKDIVQKKNYSNFSFELNRLFGDKSYKAFYKNLIEHKITKGSSFISLFRRPKNKNDIKIYDSQFNIGEFEKSLNRMKEKSENINYKVKNPYKTRPPLESMTKTKTEKILKNLKLQQLNNNNAKSHPKLKFNNLCLQDLPDIGRYNPSFDIIRKHIYQACFSTSIFKEFNKNKKKIYGRNIFNIENENKDNCKYNRNKIKQINLVFNTYNPSLQNSQENFNKTKINKNKHFKLNTSPSFNNKNSVNKSNKDLDELKNNHNIMNDSQIMIRTNGDLHSRCQKHITNLYNTTSNFSFDDSVFNNVSCSNNSNALVNLNNNHSLKFENYTRRKPINYKLNSNVESFTNVDAFNNNYPGKNKNVCIDFNKMSTSKKNQICYFEMEADKNKNPPIGAYNPKFESVFNKLTTNIFMNKVKTPLTNKLKLKKIMYNYDVPSKYILFKSLNNKNRKSQIKK